MGGAVVELDGERGVEELAVRDRVERGGADAVFVRSAEVFEPGGVDDARRREPEGGGFGGDVKGFFSRQRADLLAEGKGVVVGAEDEGDGAAVGGALAGGAIHELPSDLRQAIESDRTARSLGTDLTPLARNEWICWITSAKKEETRKRRIEVGLDRMRGGARGPCCWPGCPHR